jgi:hypothetical protein
MAEAEGHVDNQLPRVSDKAGHCSSLIPVHPGPRRVPSGVCPKVPASEGTGANVPNEIVIEAMIKGLRPGPSAQYFSRKPPQTLEKLLQKMDEYNRADNDFRQRREEAFRFSEMTRGFGGRFHPRHVRSIHNSTQTDDRGSQQQRPQYSSQASGQQQSSFRPPAPRGRGARGFGGRFGDQPRKIYCVFCGEDKGHTTRMCHVTIQKQKRDSRSCSTTESAEAGHAYCFVPFALHSRICRQSPCSFCCFGKPTSSILATASTAATNTTRSAAIRESAHSPPARL